MKTLVIIHLEPDFEATTGPLLPLVHKVVKYSNFFDRIINVTCSSALSGTLPFPQLSKFLEKEWIWGLDFEGFDEDDKARWIEGHNFIATTGHQWSEICD